MRIRTRRWWLLAAAAGGSVLWIALTVRVGAGPASEPAEVAQHCPVCGIHLFEQKPHEHADVERYELHNAVISLDRRDVGDDAHNEYKNVLRLDTQTGRAWILRPNRNIAGFSWVLVPNYD